MSAINGIFERHGKLSVAAFTHSLQTLADYGFEENQWIASNVGFGHRKSMSLSEDEVLPLHDKAAQLVVTSDARIDNRAELFETLGIARNERENFPDSRIILRAWQKWAHDCPLYLIGDYAFAIWDEREQTLFCARDHIGAKPFYYNLSPERFVFASDIKAVLAVPEVSNRLDEDFVIASLADKRFYHQDQTYFSAVKRLAPGHSLTVTRERERIEKYWFPENLPKIRFAKDDDYAENARELLTRAVADRLRTQEKIGVHLSGGLDSSAVAVLAARERRRENLSAPEVFSWQPPPDKEKTELAREYERIEMICRQENLTPIYCPINSPDILEVLKKDPTREPVHITLQTENTIQKAAQERGVRLILSGWSGDEVLSFDGRGFSAELLLRGHLWKLLREGRKQGSALKFIAKELLLLFFQDRNEGLKKLHFSALKFGRSSPSFLREELKSQVKFHKIPCRQSSIRSTLMWLWTRGMLAERMESWAASGANLNLEYAYPLSDRRLMEFVAGLPREQFVRGKWKRWIMRNAMDGILPPEVCWQPDKSEPVRVEKGLTEVYKALELAREEILASKTALSRARYLDMERLMKKLSPEVLAERPKQADITRALQFLDF